MAAVALGLLALPAAAWSAGELDSSFGIDGRVLTDFGVSSDEAYDVAVQPDGKIVAVGFIDGLSDSSANDFALARYNADGSLDSSFGGDGRVVTDFFGGYDRAYGVAIQTDGRILAAGESGPDVGEGNFALARYNLDGSLDATFDGDGRVVTQFGAHDVAESLAIQGDGKIIAAGFSGNLNAQPTGAFALARYNPDGSLDASFDGDGRVLTDFGASFDAAFDVAVQSDGKIVAAGSRALDDFALARYDPDGSLDPTFGGDGKVVTSFSGSGDRAFGVAIQGDGKIVAAGIRSLGEFALARYDPDGSLDPTFGGDGKVATDFGGSGGRAFDVALQADGKIVAVGVSTAEPGAYDDFAVARYFPNGSLDSTFGGDGTVLTDFGSNTDDEARGVAIQADGKIVAAGISFGASTDFALARYLPGPNPPQISIDDVTRYEGNAGISAFTFTVSLSRPGSKTITVSRQTVDGSARAPSDYAALAPATLTFSPGQTTKTVTMKVKGDVTIEPNETFFVKLSDPTNGTIADRSGKGTIANDDLSASSPCTITGTDGDDALVGTSTSDVICGGNGNDHLFGVGGNDVLEGENGNDVLVGGDGADLLLGGTGADDVTGENGNDTLKGGSGDDKLKAGVNSDALFGNDGNDSLDTQDGISANDSADGGSGSDSCVFDSADFVTSCP